MPKPRSIAYSDSELQWVRRNSDLPRKELHARFVAVHNRRDVTVENLKSLCTRFGWTTGPAGRRRNAGQCKVVTAEQAVWLRRHASLSRADAFAQFCDRFGHNVLTLNQLVSYRKRHGLKTGRTGQFTRGQQSWNSGKKIGSNPGSQKTQFKPGAVPANRLPIGSERFTRDGYIEVKIAQPNPYTAAKTRWMHKHVWLWTQTHGPIPDGHALKCLDGDRTNCDPDNWQAIPRGLLPRLNGKCNRRYDSAPAELQPTIMAIAKLEHAARSMNGNQK